jgi:hypothetical protein
MTSQDKKPLPAEWDAAVAAQRAGERTIASVLAEFGVSRSTFYRRLPRTDGPVRARPDPALLAGRGSAPVEESEAGPVDLAALAARMARLIARTMGALERKVGAGQAGDPEKAARALALHARMLSELRKLESGKEEGPGGDDDEPPPRSLGELRDELRGHLERIREEERSRSLPGGSDAE